MSKEQKFALGIFGLMAFAFLLAALLTDTLGEGGDSTTHYLYAKLAWSNEAYFFNHWAKPFFTVISSPFAQLGMKGMMFFNVCCTILAAWVAGLTAKQFAVTHWFYTPILVLAMPLILPVTLSGLTEPLSAFMLILSIYYYKKDKVVLALIIASLTLEASIS